ncbi:anti-sigma factor family protein [Halorhodospira halophila]|uniref:Putative transmembrane anti-sigma factor n=1 Tax=Halorhodospira halophila (strain DSM 244 / SL1) TaxID=349124 RepID=A1WU62_HALHL|nr:anti-sigma factor [Halorhodospira halophila]ABM61224.1 putative transmembrane anti-sigma factor [Halorhodospira halophila SL1]MBK1730044.1 hypothetical protein [Halorhodospira halophila]
MTERTMDCRECRASLLELEAGELDSARAERCHAHLAACPACRAWHHDGLRLRRHLASLDRRDAVSPGWVAAQLRRARVEHTTGSTVRQRLVAGVAAVAILAGGGLALYDRQPTHPEPPLAETGEGEVQEVRLAIDAERRMEGVRFHVEVPDGFELAGQPSRRLISWEGDLEPGANRLTLPVRGVPGAGIEEGELVTRIEHEGRSRELRLPVTLAQRRESES